MKNKNKIIKIASLVFSILLLSSCTVEDPIESSITYFATFDYNPIEIVELGEAFTAVVTATEGDTEIPVAESGSVDTSTVGVYTMTYSAVNSDGFSGFVTQEVIVHDPSIVGTDVSGAIEDIGRPARTGIITLIPGTTHVFHCTDFGFGGTFPMYFQMNGDVISEIPQSYIFGVTHVDLGYDPVAKTFSTVMNPQGFSYNFQYQ